jgi:hypothetical protein
MNSEGRVDETENTLAPQSGISALTELLTGGKQSELTNNEKEDFKA